MITLFSIADDTFVTVQQLDHIYLVSKSVICFAEKEKE